jgi:hypothetical protein
VAASERPCCGHAAQEGETHRLCVIAGGE